MTTQDRLLLAIAECMSWQFEGNDRLQDELDNATKAHQTYCDANEQSRREALATVFLPYIEAVLADNARGGGSASQLSKFLAGTAIALLDRP